MWIYCLLTRLSQMRSAPETLFDYKKFVIPINEGSNHWTLMVVELASRSIIYYDSKRAESNKASQYFHCVERWLLRMNREHRLSYGSGRKLSQERSVGPQPC